MKHNPPRWATRFLEWYCNPELLEEIQGDAEELFHRRLVEEGAGAAKRKFIWDVIRFCRWSNLRRKRGTYNSNELTMFKSYLLVGFRNVVRHSATSFINAFGLALGIAGAITIFIFADQFFHVDNFHEKKDRIYQVTNVVDRKGDRTDYRNSDQAILGDVPILLGPSMQEEFPGIEKVVRLEVGSGAIRYNDKVFSENIFFVDNTFFDVFTYPFLEGSQQVLSDKKKIVFTKPMAQKYFGNQLSIGETVSIKFSNNRSEEFTVGAVIDLPDNNTMYFNFLLPMEAFLDLKLKDNYDWNYLTDATFILMEPDIEPSPVFMQKYVNLQNAASDGWRTKEFIFYPFTSLTSRSYEIEGSVVGSGHPQGVWAMASIAFMLLLLACFNYMNISIATVTTRLKEIGIRKVIGGRRREIVQQFIAENFVLCTIAVGLGLLISYLALMPGLNSLISFKIPFAFSSGQVMMLFFIGLLSFIVIVSGIYPALYISGFQPVVILKGKEKFGQRSKFSRVLLTLQFVLAFTTIVGSLVYIDNTIYLKDKDWGYNHDQNILVPVRTNEQFLALRDRLTKNKNVLNLAGSANHIGYWNTRSSITKLDERIEVVDYRVGFNYLETMNLRLDQGRFFEESIQSDKVESVIINKKFAETMGWSNGLNQTFVHDSIRRNVIGIVQDFHYEDFYTDVLPVMFRIASEDKFKFLSLKVTKGRINETEELIKSEWRQIAPDDPYDGILQDDVFANFRKNITNDSKILGTVAVLAVTLACLGLFGLVSYNITRRMKEFSVRKVFGANLSQIFRLMNRDYIWILAISFSLGGPAGFLLMDSLIHHIYAEPQDAGPLPFIMAISIMAITVVVTILSQMKRIVKENPAKTLRNE